LKVWLSQIADTWICQFDNVTNSNVSIWNPESCISSNRCNWENVNLSIGKIEKFEIHKLKVSFCQFVTTWLCRFVD